MTAQEQLDSLGLGITVQMAHDFIMANLNNLGAIYNACLTYGINNDMIAEILGLDGVDGQFVSNYFNNNGFNGNALGFKTESDYIFNPTTESYESIGDAGDNMNDANIISLGESSEDFDGAAKGFVSANDTDFYSFTSTASGNITFYLDNIEGNSDLALYSSNGSQFSLDEVLNSKSGSSTTQYSYDVTAGTNYYLEVYSDDNLEDEYSLYFTIDDNDNNDDNANIDSFVYHKAWLTEYGAYYHLNSNVIAEYVRDDEHFNMLTYTEQGNTLTLTDLDDNSSFTMTLADESLSIGSSVTYRVEGETITSTIEKNGIYDFLQSREHDTNTFFNEDYRSDIDYHLSFVHNEIALSPIPDGYQYGTNELYNSYGGYDDDNLIIINPYSGEQPIGVFFVDNGNNNTYVLHVKDNGFVEAIFYEHDYNKITHYDYSIEFAIA